MHNIPEDCASNPAAPWNEPPEAEKESPFWLIDNSQSMYTREAAAEHILGHATTWLDSMTLTDLLAWAVANMPALPDNIRKPLADWAKSCVDDSDVMEISTDD